MRNHITSTPGWSDEDLRLKRMAHGTRAVAAAVIVGGIVIAAFESAPTTDRARVHEAAPASSDFTGGEPAGAAGVVPSAGEIDPALRRLDRAMESHG
jgi:hypothetical protein